MNKLIGLALTLTIAACGTNNSHTPAPKVTGAADGQKGTATNAAAYAKKTKPAGARSMGTMSSPKAGNTTIPITNVDVYAFEANVDDSGGNETMYWAYDVDVDTVYVWGQIALTCVDDNGDETGETGIASLVYEADPYGDGWFASTDSCGYSSLFGCSDDGCDWDDTAIVCEAD